MPEVELRKGVTLTCNDPELRLGRKAVMRNSQSLMGDYDRWQPSEEFVKMEHEPKDEPNETSQLLQMGLCTCTWAIVGVSLGQRRKPITVVEGMSLL